jgi:hypothetical protein
LDQALPGDIFEKVSARKDIARLDREYRVHHPVELHATQTLQADRARAEILPGINFRPFGALDQLIDCEAEGRR